MKITPAVNSYSNSWGEPCILNVGHKTLRGRSALDECFNSGVVNQVTEAEVGERGGAIPSPVFYADAQPQLYTIRTSKYYATTPPPTIRSLTNGY